MSQTRSNAAADSIARALRLAPLLALLCAMMTLPLGCSREAEPQATGLLDPAAERMVRDRADAVLTRSAEEVEPAPEGAGHVPRLREIDAPEGRFTIPERLIVTTPGTERLRFPLHRLPHALLIDDAGRLVVAWPDGVESVPPPDAGEGTELVSGEPARALQWNAEGTELLLSGPDVKRTVSWPELEQRWEGTPDQDLRGRLAFAPKGDGDLWLFEEAIDFNAASEIRIFWRVLDVPRDGGTPNALYARDLRLASIGTLPILQTAYGTPRQPYQILADPAPLYRLGDDLRRQEALTDPGEDVDLHPQADATGRIWFLRATRQVETRTGGGVLGPGARAWSVMVGEAESARRVTAEPTVQVAVSPNGQRVALLVVRRGEGLVIESPARELLERDLSATAAAERDFRERFDAVAGAVESAFHTLELSRQTEETPFGTMLTAPPSAEDLAWMDQAFRAAIERQFELTLPSGVEALGIVDGLMGEGDGLWRETPAMILAIAGFHGGVMAREEGVRWSLEMARPDLGLDAEVADFTPGELIFQVAGSSRPVRFRVGGLALMHNPFYVARERIAGRMSLDLAARDALASRARPILLTENHSPDNLSLELLHQAEQAGMDLTGEDLESFARVVEEKPDALLANLAVLIYARQTGDRALALSAAMNLAEGLPWSADAILLAVEPLQWVGMTETSLAFARRAEEIAPENPNVLFDVALAFYDALEFDSAAERLDRVEELDTERHYEETLEHVRALLAESRARQAAAR